MLAYLKDTVMHETGHALGLRHNFRASSVRSEEQAAQPLRSRPRPSLSGSVMDYPGMNLAAPGQAPVTPFNVKLGPYDLWAIEYAYQPFPKEQEAAALTRIAARSTEPELAFGTDEDQWLALDPQVQTGDLGQDPLLFAQRRLAIARDLLQRQEAKPPGEEAEPGLARRTVAYALSDAGNAATMAVRLVGGLNTLRDQPGSGRDVLVPVPAAQQRAALALVTQVLRGEGLSVSPALQRRLAPDYFERADAVHGGQTVATDFVPEQLLLAAQQRLLGHLLSDAVVTRVQDSRGKLDQGVGALSPLQLFDAVNAAVWDGPASDARRELQRVHLNALSGLLLRPAAYSRAQARAELRAQAQRLLQTLQRQRDAAKPGTEQVAHLGDAISTLQASLSAPLVRASP